MTQNNTPVAFVTGYGMNDTHALTIDGQPNTHPLAGQPYSTITGVDIAAMVANPPCVEKTNAQWVIPSVYAAFDAREHSAQRERGRFRALVLDIDENNLDVDFVVECLQAVIGKETSALIYSTKSSKPDRQKWRGVVPLENEIAGADYRDVANAFFDLLVEAGQGALIPDRALARVGQVFFLPNRGEFYDHRTIRARRLALTPDHRIMVRVAAERARVEAIKVEAEARRAAKAAERASRGFDERAQVSEVFNERHDIADLLARYHYKQDGASNHWQSPYQSSGSYATLDAGDYWVSLSGSDAAAGIGAPSANGNRFGDAFDLYCHFEHGGDFSKAVRAYAEEAGLSGRVNLVFPDRGDTVGGLVFGPKIAEAKPAVFTAAPAAFDAPAVEKNAAVQIVEDDIDESPLKAWVFLSGDNEFHNIETGEVMSVSAFNLAMAPITPSVEVEKADGGTSRKKLPAARTLIEYMKGDVAAHTMYRPDVDDRFFSADGIPYVNSYLPHTVTVADPGWADHPAWRVCKGHIENILNGDADLIIKWIAHNVQRPGKKILWSPIIVGVQGDGKTTLLKIMQAAMGKANVGPVSPEAMFSDFTGWAEGACVKVLEEIRVHGNSRHNAMNKLKPLITNDSVEIVRKGKDGKQIANVTNYMALTNHMDALALDEGDRRWGVFKTRFQTRQDMLAEMGDEYWHTLHSAIEKHPGVIRGWLLSVDLSAFNRVVGPETNAFKRMMIEATRSPAEADIAEAIALGGFGVCSTVAATDCINTVIQGLGSRTVYTSTLATVLREMGWMKCEHYVKWRGKNRRVYYRPDAVPNGADASEISRILRGKLDDTDDGFSVGA